MSVEESNKSILEMFEEEISVEQSVDAREEAIKAVNTEPEQKQGSGVKESEIILSSKVYAVDGLLPENVDRMYNGKGNMLNPKELDDVLPTLHTAEKGVLEVTTKDGIKITNSNIVGVVSTDPKTGRKEFIATASDGFNATNNSVILGKVINAQKETGRSYCGEVKSNFKTMHAIIYTNYSNGLLIGYDVYNAYNGSSKLQIGCTVNKANGYTFDVNYMRLQCKNGMLTRMKLGEKSNLIQESSRLKILEYLRNDFSRKHTIGMDMWVDKVIQNIQMIDLITEPLNQVIELSKVWTWTDITHLQYLMDKFVGKRYEAKIRNELRYNHSIAEGDPRNLWHIINAMTWISSHDTELSESAADTLREKSAEMMNEVLFVKA